jgi:N-acetylneuraminate synthase
MKRTFSINGRSIGPDFPPYIIAEISANHNGSIENALKIIDVAKDAGADAVKLQTYRADTITLKSDSDDFKIFGGLWDGKSLYELYEEAQMPWEWHDTLFDYAKKRGITIFSSPFDNTAVDLLSSLGAPAYKIASFEAVDLPLIKYAARLGKPLIISTGMASASEILEALEAAKAGGAVDVALLHCVSGYPAPAADYNLRTLVDMAERYSVVVGLSDHTLDTATAIASVALGASIIEKHVTLDRKGGGADDSFSLEPAELKQLCEGCRTAWSALGKVNYERTASERGNVKFRRSLYFVRALNEGQAITPEDVRSVRPGFGAPPKYYESIIGKRVAQSVSANTPVDLENLFD